MHAAVTIDGCDELTVTLKSLLHLPRYNFLEMTDVYPPSIDKLSQIHERTIIVKAD